MEYWGDGIDTVLQFPQCRYVRGLLEFENTTCGTWSNFFKDMVRLQGNDDIESYKVDWYESLGSTPNGQFLIQPYINDLSSFFQGAPEAMGQPVVYSQSSGSYIPANFAVEKWADDSSAFNLTYVMSERDDSHNVLDSIQPTKLLSNGNIIPQLALTGLAGQGNDDPVSEFFNHAINEYNGQYYDPSYGTPQRNSQNDWESESIDFFGAKAIATIMENGMEKDYYLIWIAEQNTSSPQMNFQSIW
jgi:hypothetical protein